MYKLTSKLIIYRGIGKDSILMRLSDICRRLDEGGYNKEELAGEVLDQVHRLLDVATTYGFDHNLWHCYLAYLLAMTETPFTLVSEKVGKNTGSVNQFARSDFSIFRQLFDYDFSRLEQALDLNCFSVIEHYQSVNKKEHVYNKSVSEKVLELSGLIEQSHDTDEMYDIITDFYRRYGVGKFGLNKAFRISENPDGELLEPITNTGDMHLSDLIGYEEQKKRLIENTEAFVHGMRANNVLLYGDAGTGKSTSIKAILNEYYSQGLRMIEVYKHQFRELARVVNQIKNRNYRFIIYMDDLSFEDTETEYKYLKAIIEGGLEPRPENVLIYATSNRRHLIHESWKDKQDHDEEDLHRNDTVQEKLSLSDRFGVTIGYLRPSQQEYYKIVEELAKRYPDIHITQEELRRQANQWELHHGGFSGRTAQQFIDYLAGVKSGEENS